MKRRTFVGAATGLAALGTLGSPAFGQAKITGDVRFLCGFAPGGNADLLCRLVAESARPDVGQNIIVENKTGAGGFIANETLANAPPDGRTIGLAAMAAMCSGRDPQQAPKALTPSACISSTNSPMSAGEPVYTNSPSCSWGSPAFEVNRM